MKWKLKKKKRAEKENNEDGLEGPIESVPKKQKVENDVDLFLNNFKQNLRESQYNLKFDLISWKGCYPCTILQNSEIVVGHATKSKNLTDFLNKRTYDESNIGECNNNKTCGFHCSTIAGAIARTSISGIPTKDSCVIIIALRGTLNEMTSDYEKYAQCQKNSPDISSYKEKGIILYWPKYSEYIVYNQNQATVIGYLLPKDS